MFIFSTVHDWQADVAVKQVLVFPNEEVKELFDREMLERIEKDKVEGASDSNAGAIYKLRAVLDSHGKYVPIIRCGITGGFIWEGRAEDDWRIALRVATTKLANTVANRTKGYLHKHSGLFGYKYNGQSK